MIPETATHEIDGVYYRRKNDWEVYVPDIETFGKSVHWFPVVFTKQQERELKRINILLQKA